MTSELLDSERVGGKMRGRTTINKSGSLRGLMLSSFVLLAGIASLAENRALAQDAAASCAPVVGRVVSLQGNVQVQRTGTRSWQKVSRLDTSICAGDRLRTDALSRAALFVQPETLVRVDQNTTISVNQTTAEILVEFHTDAVAQAAQKLQSCGAGYFITRFPRKFKVSTPHMNAAVEGTEFMVESSCKASTLTVLEGQVETQAVATQESRSLTAGQRMETGTVSGSEFSSVVRPVDAVQWVLHFPPLGDVTAETEVPSAEQCQVLSLPANYSCLVRRAEILLRLGRSDEAMQSVDEALALASADGNAEALKAIMLVARNENVAALEMAGAATLSAPGNVRAWIALSYAEQANFRLERALESAGRAQSLAPESSLVNARNAELLLSLGRTSEAEAAALAAVSANPAESRAHSVLGFVRLAQIETRAAKAEFDAAIVRDSFAPLPRLGLGLAMIREGGLVAGREQLEIAVALDPTSSLLRSYVGKAYYEENTRARDELAGVQYRLAADMDPNDPTPHLYDAIRKQTLNRPVDALRDMRLSVQLNDNRAVFRSRLKLDEDLATRSASQGRIYADLGFEKLAILDGWRAVTSEPGDFSGHRLLADSYASLPRHELARVNELFTSQLLQPANLTPVPPQLGEVNQFILDSAGPSDIAFNEFNPLFNRNRLAVQASGTVGGNDTWGNDFSFAGVQDQWSFSLGQFHFETDGFRPNNDLELDTYNAFVQFRQSDRTSLMTELRVSRRDQGDLKLRFDPGNFDPLARQQEDAESIRIGANHVFSPRSELLASIVYQSAKFETDTPPFANISGDVDSLVGEIQHILDMDRLRLISGLRQTHRDHFERQDVTIPEPAIREIDFDLNSSSLYFYGYLPLTDRVSSDIGVSVDLLESRTIDKDQVNPKIGLSWKPSDRTTLRIAAVRTLQPDTYSRQDVLPRLEPTQVAGINQVFLNAQGVSEWHYGLGMDYETRAGVFVGAEVSKRDLDIPVVAVGPPDQILIFHSTELQARAYLHWTPIDSVAISGGIQYDEEDNDQGASFEDGVSTIRTRRFPVELRYFHVSGLSAETTATYVDQKGDFLVFLPDPPFIDSASDGDRFWVLDAAVRYRLPRRKGMITISAENLLDEEFRFLDLDPENPEFIPERLVSLKFTVTF